MRRILDGLYAGALVLACSAMTLIALLVFVQVMGRVIDRVAVWLGFGRIGLMVPSLAEIGGFLFVAAAFLALPYTLRSAGHIRVTLALRALPPLAERVATALVLAAGAGLAGFAARAVAVQAMSSMERGSVSYGLIAMPLWIPQGVMALGLGLLVLALLDELAAALRGHDPAFRAAERGREAGEGGGH